MKAVLLAVYVVAASPGGGVGLFVSACIDGTLHGAPFEACREFQIRHFPTVDSCNRVHDAAAAEWLNGLHAMGIDATLRAVRCGPAEKEDDDI